jgi:5-methylcytosine-specific restriction endonuclease McrA
MRRSKDIPAAIRHAVILRDHHCQWTGGCDQPAAACEVDHVTHKADGGKTSMKDWTVVLNPDGTTTAWNRDKTKILHSHSPPAQAG